MVFHSFPFLASFAALVVFYYAIRLSYRWPLLLAASLCFYATFDPRYVLLLLAVTAAAYASALAIVRTRDLRRKRLVLATGVAISLVPLSPSNLRFPDRVARSSRGRIAGHPGESAVSTLAIAGLSFYTLSCVAYLVDVSAGRLPAARHRPLHATSRSFPSCSRARSSGPGPSSRRSRDR